MKVAIYKKDGTYATELKSIDNPQLTDGILTFNNGNLSGYDENHILLDNNVEAPETIDEAKVLDQISLYTIEKVDETAELKKQQTDLIFELMMKGVL